MPAVRRSLSHVCYAGLLVLAIGCFYFSISEGLFAWFFPDELGAVGGYNGNGLLGCTENYYLNTTINRLSAAFSMCAMAGAAQWFSTPFMGWVIVRLVFYMGVPLSIAVVLRSLLKIPFKWGVIAALLIGAAALFVMSDTIFYMFGLDLSIYGLASITFFLLIAVFPQSLENQRYFVLFCLLFFLNLNSHEAFLPISGFFIPLYAYYRHAAIHRSDVKIPLNILVKDTLRDRNIVILCAVYAASALFTLLSPSLVMRQHLWPATGTFFDRIGYMLLALEEAIYLMARAYGWTIPLFATGVAFRLSPLGHPLQGKKLLYVFLFCMPLAYVLVTGFLIGTTPSLWVDALRPEKFKLLEHVFSHLHHDQLDNHGGLAIRQNLPLYPALFLDIFLAGFFAFSWLGKQPKRQMGVWPLQATLSAIALLFFFFHPDGTGSVKTFAALIENASDTGQNNYPQAILPWLAPRFPFADGVSALFNHRKQPGNHISSIANIAADAYLKTKRGGMIHGDALDPVYNHMDDGYKGTRDLPWISQIYMMYGVTPIEKCIEFSKAPHTDSYCSNTAGEPKLQELLKTYNFGPPSPLVFKAVQGIEAKAAASCTQWLDASAKGEHFAAASDFKLTKGFTYFTLDILPSKTELYFYIIADKTGVIFPWLNQVNGSGGWRIYGDNANLEPIFSQTETAQGSEKLRAILYSPTDQTIQIRWQHGYDGTTMYNGFAENNSTVCKVEYGKLLERK